MGDGGGGFWGSFTRKLSIAGDTIADGAKSVGKSIGDSIDELKAPPSTVRCSNMACAKDIQVPSSTFDWVCSLGHVSSITEDECPQCRAARPEETKPTVICPECDTYNVVPTSTFTNAFRTASESTKKWATETGEAAEKKIEAMNSTPDVFRCRHCRTPVSLTDGKDWKCGVCDADNAGSVAKCTTPDCAGEKALLKEVCCGTCHKITEVPMNNFTDSVYSGATNIGKSTTNLFYSLVGSIPHVVCPRCETTTAVKNLVIPTEKPADDSQGYGCPKCGNFLSEELVRQEAVDAAYRPDATPSGDLAPLHDEPEEAAARPEAGKPAEPTEAEETAEEK